MKRQFVCLFLIQLLLLFAVTASMSQVEVVFILGYVEVRKQGQNHWEVARKDMELSAEDLVRIPPKATLRVRLENGDAVYFVSGQESPIDELAPVKKKRIVDGRTRSSKAANRSRHRVGQNRQAVQQRTDSPMTNRYVEFLLSKNEEDANDESVRSFAQSVVRDISITTNTGYPNRNIARVQHLFNALKNLTIRPSDDEQSPASQEIQAPSTTLKTRQGSDLDIARLYMALLNAAGVEARPRGDNNVPLFIVFDSGIPAGAAQSVTVNRKLYFVENDTVWLPTQITPSTDNFIKAWYKGSDVNRITNYELRITN